MAEDGRINIALERVTARLKMADTVTGLLWLLAVAVVYLLVVIAIDQVSPLERPTRLTLLAVLGGAEAVGLAVTLLMPTLRRINSLYVARLIEQQSETLFRNSLVSYVELRHATGIHPAVLDAVAQKASADLRHIDPEAVVSRRPTRIAAITLVVAVALAAVFALTSAKGFGTSLGRALGGELAAPTATRIVRVLPEMPAEVVAGDPLEFTCVVADELPDKVTLHMTADGRQWDVAPMQSANRRQWQFQLDHVYRKLTFHVRAGDARSDDRTVEIVPLPEVASVRTRLTYPAYTMLAPATLDSGNVEALVGTQVEVIATTNKTPARPPTMNWSDGGRRTTMRLARDKRTARGQFTVDKSLSYRIRFYDEATRRENPAAIAYRVTAVKDRPPTIEITDDLGDTISVPVNGRLALGYRAADDYGLDTLSLQWLAGPKAPPQTVGVKRTLGDQAALRLAGTTSVSVADIGLKTGDEVDLWLEATDRVPTGSQAGRSRVIHVTVTGPDDGGSGGNGEATAGAGGEGDTDPQDAGTGEGAGSKLTGQQRRDLEKMQETLKKLADATGGAGKSPSPGDGGSEPKDAKQGDSDDGGKTPQPDPNGGQGDDSGKSADNDSSGGPAEDVNPKNGNRPADAKIPDRKNHFTESGAPVGTPAGDRRLLQTVGADIRKLERQLQQETVDPKLLKELGWTEAELRQFVAEYKDRFGKLAASGDDSAVARPSGSGGEVTSVAGGNGAVGDGAMASDPGGAGDGESSAETRARRSGSRYGGVINAYERSVSAGQTDDE